MDESQRRISLEQRKENYRGFIAVAAWTAAREASFLFPTRPSFSTAHRKRSYDLSHIRETLSPGVPVVPLRPVSFETVGQWLVCCVGASPTEDSMHCFWMPSSASKCGFTIQLTIC